MTKRKTEHKHTNCEGKENSKTGERKEMTAEKTGTEREQDPGEDGENIKMNKWKEQKDNTEWREKGEKREHTEKKKGEKEEQDVKRENKENGGKD